MQDFSNHLIELGQYVAFLAFALALVQANAPLAAYLLKRPSLAQLSIKASSLVFICTTIAGLSIIYALVTSNFSVLYVAQNSNTALPLFYKVTALWGNHEGSLYLWVWVLTFYTLLVSWHGANRYARQLPVILAVQGWLIVGFFGLILFLSSPFERLFPIPVEGRDLNPLLQDPGMVIHPPMLYMGYVGFSVPFAFAMAALITRWQSANWVGFIRRWTLIAWGFLTVGIMLGGWWAYYELGWGGYWAWDPVENASFMPWLLGTALIHSITVQERRRMLHTWNIFLVISTFSLSLLGTFLVRSGVLSSVHAFAVDPGRGAYILAFMTLVLTISFGIFLIKGRYQQAQEVIGSWLSREALFIWNNVLFIFGCAVVLLATLYPLALDSLTGQKITVLAPYFNSVMIPVFFLIMFLMAIGPLVPWRKVNVLKLRKRLIAPILMAVTAGAGVAFVLQPGDWMGTAASALAALVLGSLITDYGRAVRQRRQQLTEGLGRSLIKTVLANRRHYGGMVVHFGIVVITLGLIGSGVFRSEVTVNLAPGDTVRIAGHQLQFDTIQQFQRDNYITTEASVRLLDSGRVVTPERRRYPVQESPTTETGIDSTLWRDVYVVLSEPTAEGKWVFQIYVNPLVQFIWFGGLIILLGLFVSLSGPRARRLRQTFSESAAIPSTP